jgi:hypothetical protein
VIPISGLVQDLLADLERRFLTKPPGAAVPSGIRALDVMLGGFAPGELLLAVGHEAVPFAVAVCRHVAVVLEQSVRVETEDPAGFTTRLLAADGWISLRRLRRGSLSEQEWGALVGATERVAQSTVTFATAHEANQDHEPALLITTGPAVRLRHAGDDAPILAAVDADRSSFEELADIVIRFQEVDPITTQAQVEREGRHLAFLSFAFDGCGRLWDPTQPPAI